MHPKDIQAEIHIIQTQLQAIKADPANAAVQASSIEEALEAVRARCERIRDNAALPLSAPEAFLPIAPIPAMPEPIEQHLPAV